MPPKVRITKEEIVNTALSLLREEGLSAVNARNIAARLSCSTQPVFSNFATMDELQDALTAAAYELYLGFLKTEAASGKYPPYKAFGMAYIRFASEEKELFRHLFMCDRSGKDLAPTEDFTVSVETLMKGCGLSRESAERMHLEMWATVHGIGTMMATSFLSLEWDLISTMLSDIYQGLLVKHTAGEAKK